MSFSSKALDKIIHPSPLGPKELGQPPLKKHCNAIPSFAQLMSSLSRNGNPDTLHPSIPATLTEQMGDGPEKEFLIKKIDIIDKQPLEKEKRVSALTDQIENVYKVFSEQVPISSSPIDKRGDISEQIRALHWAVSGQGSSLERNDLPPAIDSRLMTISSVFPMIGAQKQDIALPELGAEDTVDTPPSRAWNFDPHDTLRLDSSERTDVSDLDFQNPPDSTRAWNFDPYDISRFGNSKRAGIPHLASQNLPDLISAAEEMQRQGKWNESLEAANKALRIDKDNFRALICKADALRGLHRWNKSLKAIEKVLRCEPNNVTVLLYAANVLGWLDRWDESLEAANKALRIDRDNFRGLISKSDAMRHCGLTDGALDVTKALLLKADFLRIHGWWNESLEAINWVLKMMPNDSMALLCKAQVLQLLSRFDESIEVADRILVNPFQSLISMDPIEVRRQALLCKSIALSSLNRFDESLTVIEAL